VEQGEVLSYRDLWADATALAGQLREAGVVPGRVAAVAATRVPKLITVLLATRIAGGAFSILDLDFPSRRLIEQVRRMDAAVLVPTDPARMPDELRAAAVGAGVAVLDSHPMAAPTAEMPAGTDDLAYVAFTSGTTGGPLGVRAGETPMTTFFAWYANRFGLSADDRFAVLSGLSHDPVLREMLLALWLGATACIPDAGVLDSAATTVRWLARQCCTVVHVTPPRGRLLAAAAESEGVTLPDVRLLALAGAEVTGADHEALRRVFPRARLISLYGTTETPQGVSVVDLADEYLDGHARRHPVVGTGSPSAELLVLRPGGDVAPINAVGEIAVRSPYLATGYLSPQPADRFGPDCDGCRGVRIYRTGDLGRYRPDGMIEFLGRADDQLSVDGNRVESADVEAAARDATGDAECLAVWHQDRLMLLVRGTSLSPDEIRRRLADRLPPAAVPHNIVPTDLPLTTPNGKIDRARLVAVLARRSVAASSGTKESESTLATVLGVMADVLEVADIDADASFFTSGATSLGLLRMHVVLRERCDATLGLAELFEFQTPNRLAARLDRRSAPDNRVAAPLDRAAWTSELRERQRRARRAGREPG
jgi:amino acid adenylation domain-containing protein